MTRSLSITLDEEDWHQVIAILDAYGFLDHRENGDEEPIFTNARALSQLIEEKLLFIPRETVLNPATDQHIKAALTAVHTLYRRTKDGFRPKEDV